MKITSLSWLWISREQYQQAIAEVNSPDITTYHGLPWLDAIANGFSAEICFARSIGVKGETLALVSFMARKHGPFRLIGSPLAGMFTEFSGPIFVPNLNAQTIQKLMAELHEFVVRDRVYIEFGSKGEQTWARMLNVRGYRNIKRATLIVDLLSGEQAVWSTFEGRARNMVRKAEKAGVVVDTIVPDEQWIGQYYTMLVNTFRRQGVAPPHPLSFYKQLIELSNAGIARCLMAEFNGDMIAGGIFLVDQKRMLYLSGASTRQGMNLAATSLLQWHVMKQAIQLGISEYDMGGLGVPSIDKFKRSFGGKDFMHNRWVFSSKLFKMIEPVARVAIKKGWLRMEGR